MTGDVRNLLRDVSNPSNPGKERSPSEKVDSLGRAGGGDQGKLTSDLSEMSENLTEMSVSGPAYEGHRLTDSEVALLDGPFGRVSDARAARMLGETVIRTEELVWSIDLVKLRLSQAARLCERVVKADRPSSKGGFWPSTAIEYTDQIAMLSTGELQRLWRQQNRAPRSSASARDIAEMQQAIGWPGRYLGAERYAERERRVLHLWIWTEAVDRPWEDGWKASGFSRAQAHRLRDSAFRIILGGLVKDGVLA